MNFKFVYRIYDSGRKAKCILCEKFDEIISLESFNDDKGLSKFNVYGAGNYKYEYVEMNSEEKAKCINDIFKNYDNFDTIKFNICKLKNRKISIHDLLTIKEFRKLKLNKIENESR